MQPDQRLSVRFVQRILVLFMAESVSQRARLQHDGYCLAVDAFPVVATVPGEAHEQLEPGAFPCEQRSAGHHPRRFCAAHWAPYSGTTYFSQHWTQFEAIQCWASARVILWVQTSW